MRHPSLFLCCLRNYIRPHTKLMPRLSIFFFMFLLFHFQHFTFDASSHKAIKKSLRSASGPSVAYFFWKRHTYTCWENYRESRIIKYEINDFFIMHLNFKFSAFILTSFNCILKHTFLFEFLNR